MKTTDRKSDRINDTAARWYRVRPALRWTLALSVTVWLGVLSFAAARGLGSPESVEAAVRLLAQNASAILNLLAAAAVAAVVVEGVRTSSRMRKVRRKLRRSVRLTQRLILGPHAARA